MANFRGLQDAEQALREAYRRGDREAMKEAARFVVDRRASRDRSMQNIVRDQESYAPQAGQSGLKNAWEGLGGTLPNIARQATALALPKSVESRAAERMGLVRPGQTLDDNIAEARSLDDKMELSGKAGRFFGDVAVTAPIGGGAGALARAGMGAKALSGAGRGMLPAARRALSYGAEGAAGTALTDADQIAQGGALGMAAQPLFNRFGRVARAIGTGMRRTPEADLLLQHGADLTPGQMNPTGWLANMERTAQTSPVAGRALAEAREKAAMDVVPNLEADLMGKRRIAGEGLEASSRRRHRTTGALYRGVDSEFIDPAEVARLRAGRADTAQEVMRARGAARRSGERSQQAVEDAVEQAESKLIKAESRLARNRKPELTDAYDRDVRVARAQLRRAQYAVADMDRRIPVRMGTEAGREAAARAVPEAIKDLNSLMRSSMRRNPLGDQSTVVREVLGKGKAAMKGQTVGELRRARSDLKKIEAAYRYGRGRAADMAAANVVSDSIKWFDDKIEKALAHRPDKLARSQRADEIYRDTAPIEDAKHAALRRGDKQVRSTDLLAALDDSMTPGVFNRGQGGTTRRVAGALKDLETHNKASAAIERHPVLRTVLNVGMVPSTAVMASGPMRRMLQGNYGAQKLLKRALAGRGRGAEVLSRGLVPAYLDEQNEAR